MNKKKKLIKLKVDMFIIKLSTIGLHYTNLTTRSMKLINTRENLLSSFKSDWTLYETVIALQKD